jgi:hypothetical protein
MSVVQNVGTWTEEEKALFQQGLDEFGLNFRKIEEYMGGSRSLLQIRNYYQSLKRKNPRMFSPKKLDKISPRKRSGAVAGNISTDTPTKKSKSAKEVIPVSTANWTPKRAPTSAARTRAPVATQATSFFSASPEDFREEEEFEEMPRSVPTSVIKKVVLTKEETIAVATKTSGSGSDALAARETVGGSGPLKSIMDFLEKEEVQTVLAGVLGFVVVSVAKMWMK